jgi:Family of unknown function (DUF5993)
MIARRRGGLPRLGLTSRKPPLSAQHSVIIPSVRLMDIIILVLLAITAFLIVRGAKRGLILSLWVISLVLMLGLFRYHVTSALDLSF